MCNLSFLSLGGYGNSSPIYPYLNSLNLSGYLCIVRDGEVSLDDLAESDVSTKVLQEEQLREGDVTIESKVRLMFCRQRKGPQAKENSCH